jgi:Spy/CpxP family protein refolding chaperone
MRKYLLIPLVLSFAMFNASAEAGQNKVRHSFLSPKMYQELQLTQQQIDSISLIKKQTKREIKEHKTVMKTVRQQIRALNPDDANYLDQVRALATKKASQAAAITELKVMTHAKIKQQLTKEQRVELGQLRANKSHKKPNKYQHNHEH